MSSTQMLIREQVECFSLPQTLDCGQCFRWRPDDAGRWHGVVGQLAPVLWMEGDTLTCEGVGEEDYHQILRPYLALDEDYPSIQRRFSQDAVLAQAIAYAPGIRVLRQDRWEALASFIISQNNNVRRIQGIVDRLCMLLGEEFAPGCYTFPRPQQLAAATVEELAPLQAGYRARYLIDAGQKVAQGIVSLEEAATLPTPEAREQLMAICGVGQKVADCALLYGFARDELIPMDVWMKRVMAAFYPNGFPSELADQAGIAQQYLFHYGRTCPEALGPAFWTQNKKQKNPASK